LSGVNTVYMQWDQQNDIIPWKESTTF
jgi:hypothetical protein